MSDDKPTTVGFFSISYPVTHEHRKKRWVRIGSATLQSNGNIAAHLDAIPIKWDGDFYLFPRPVADQHEEEETSD